MANDLASDDRWPDVQKAVAALVEALTTAFAPIAAAVAACAQAIESAMWEGYRAAGSPYGESAEGMQRFVREEMAFQRAAQEYCEQVSWRRSLVALKERFTQEKP